ncbi:MAG: hypothetical protein FJ125_14565, partial [Deltaproteobacteria bacterium]|nr:hypothetical protein [Deltaproteobacteria bacterium]
MSGPPRMTRAQPFVDTERRRSLRSWRPWLVLALPLGLAAATGLLPSLLVPRQPWALLAAVPLGHLALGASVALTRLSLRDGGQALKASLLFFYRPYGASTLAFYALIALAEELLFRGIPLTLLGDGWPQILLFSAVFGLI